MCFLYLLKFWVNFRFLSIGMNISRMLSLVTFSNIFLFIRHFIMAFASILILIDLTHFLIFVGCLVLNYAPIILSFVYDCICLLKYLLQNFEQAHIVNLVPYSFFFYIFLLLSSFLALSFLGLYGVLICNFFGIFFFWLSLLYVAPDFILQGKSISMSFFKWFTMGNSVVVHFELLFDVVSFSFAFLTASIALFVNTYAFAYFRYEPNVDRLIIFLNAFVISMLLLVLSGNLIVLFLGWELIGLTSFLLINFWSTRVGTLKAAFKAYSFNKLSDFLIFVGVILTGFTFNDFNISNILTNFEKYDSLFLLNILGFKMFDLISFFFLGAAFIKSAQIGCHIWLPDSMEAPVPASALIHSATLVSAGIFLILRLYPLFEHSSIFYIVTPIVGICTAFLGGLSAFYQNDLKRILAYSTISHCGFLMFLTTLGSFEFTLLYLYVHGFFKAIAFFCVGNIIRFNKNYQDIRRMGQLWKYLPYEFSVIFVSMLNLSGLPFFFGFYIKHLLFTGVDDFLFASIIYAILFLAALTGTFYFYKVAFYVFFDTKKSRKSVYDTTNRWNLFSPFYSNSGIAATTSILALFFTAYLIIFFFFYTLVYSKNISVCFNSVFYKNFSYWLYNQDHMTLFNFSFLNVAVLICLFLLLYVKWNNSIDLSRTFESAFIFLIFFAFFVCCIYFLRHFVESVWGFFSTSIDIFISYYLFFFRMIIRFVKCAFYFFFHINTLIFSIFCFYIYKCGYLIIFEEFTQGELRVFTRDFLRRLLHLPHPIRSGCKYIYDAIISPQNILALLRELIKEYAILLSTAMRYCLSVNFARLLYINYFNFFWTLQYTNSLLYNNLVILLKREYSNLLFILSKTTYKTYYLLLIEYFCLTYRSVVKFLDSTFYLFKQNVKDLNHYSSSGALRADYNIFIFKLKWFPRHLLYNWRFFRIRVKINLVLSYRRFKKRIW